MIETRNATVALSGTEKAVEFAAAYNYFYIKNDSQGMVYVSMSSNITAGADGVFAVDAGGSCGTAHGYPATKLYLLGTGSVQVCGTGSADNPFKSALRGGDNYVHPTGSGYKHIPSGGTVGQILKNTDDGTVEWSDLKIGGTNLLLNSAFIGTAHWAKTNQTTTLSASASVLKVVPDAKKYSGVSCNITTNVKSGKHIVSVYAKADTTTNFGINIQSFDRSNVMLSSVGNKVQLTNDWQRISFAFDIDPSAARIWVMFSNSASEGTTPFYIKQPKLEIGTEVTDWSPSPYDTPVGVQRGTVTLTPSGNKQVPVNVQFAVPYKAAPSIAASSSGYQVGSDITSNSPIIYNKTTTGFTVNSQYAYNVTIDWIAVGEYDTALPTVTITSQPQDMSAANGASATCSVTAEGTNLSYQWLFSADGGATWLTLSCKTAQYTVVAQTQYNGNLYRCRVTNGAGVSVLSDAATLTVTD